MSDVPQDLEILPLDVPLYKEDLENFEENAKKLLEEFKVSMTPKYHILIDHVPQVVEKTGRGLQEGSEEVVEATHSKFDRFWARYKVMDFEDPQHGTNLLACTTDFNSTNI